MRNKFGFILIVGSLLATATAFSQTPAATQASTAAVFDVASVRPAVAPDPYKMMMDLRAGKKPESMRIAGTRASFVYMSLKELIASAYKMRTYEINGADWLTTDRFDIEARLPDGATKDDVPAMLQALLVERFKLAAHREMQDQPVLALVIDKSGSKLKEATEPSLALDPSAPLKPGESLVDSVDGPIRLTKNADGSTTYNMGERGSFTLRFDSDTLSMHMAASSITMKGFAVMMNSLGGGEGRQVVDQTGLTGKYQAAVEFPLTDLISSLSSQGINIPTGPPRGGTDGTATDPEGSATVSAALAKLGLRLEKNHAQVQRLVVDHIEKMPTEN